jgi:hypothetical protein
MQAHKQVVVRASTIALIKLESARHLNSRRDLNNACYFRAKPALHFERSVEPKESAERSRVSFPEMLGALDAERRQAIDDWADFTVELAADPKWPAFDSAPKSEEGADTRNREVLAKERGGIIAQTQIGKLPIECPIARIAVEAHRHRFTVIRRGDRLDVVGTVIRRNPERCPLMLQTVRQSPALTPQSGSRQTLAARCRGLRRSDQLADDILAVPSRCAIAARPGDSFPGSSASQLCEDAFRRSVVDRDANPPLGRALPSHLPDSVFGAGARCAPIGQTPALRSFAGRSPARPKTPSRRPRQPHRWRNSDAPAVRQTATAR